MATRANWTRVVVALFTVAMFYASACTTICAVGICPNQARQTSSHACEPSPSHHSHHSTDQAPDKSDCPNHALPSVLFLKSGDVSQFELSISSHVPLPVLLDSSAVRSTNHSTHSQPSDQARPFAPNIPLHQQNLRHSHLIRHPIFER